MKTLFLRLTASFDARVRRERYLIALALLGGVALIVWSALINPAHMRRVAAERGLGEQRAQLAALAAQTQALQAEGQAPEARAAAELAGLKQQLEALNARYRALGGSLVSPQQVGALLEGLLGRQAGLRLLSLRTLPVAPVLGAKEAAALRSVATPAAAPAAATGPANGAVNGSGTGANAAAGLYKHGVEIKLEGGYADLVAYLERLEKSPQKLLWNSVTLSAENHPRLVLTLTVFTLSLDRTWLAV